MTDSRIEHPFIRLEAFIVVGRSRTFDRTEPSAYAAATSGNQQGGSRVVAAVIANQGRRPKIGLQPVARQKGESQCRYCTKSAIRWALSPSAVPRPGTLGARTSQMGSPSIWQRWRTT